MSDSPIRVAHIIGKWIGGGVESVVMNYYRNINKNVFQFDFLCDSDSTNIPYEEINKLGGRVILIPPYQKLIEYEKTLVKIFKENKYKIVHSHINVLSVFSLRAAKKAGVPIRIAHSHSTTNKNELAKNLIKQVLRPFSKIYATDYFCCGELAGRWLFGNKTYDKGKVFLLYNAIDLDKFKFNNEIRISKRNELNLDNESFVIGHIGRFVRQKNHSFLLNIFKTINDIDTNAKLVLAGEGPLLDSIKEEAKLLGISDNVIFLGQRKDANELYQAFDAFVMPSLYEGLPVVGVEAQASDLPCFFSTTITKEISIINNCNFLSLNDDYKMWALEIEKVKKFNRKDISEELIDSNFNIKHTVSLLEHKYTCLLGKIK